VGEDPIALSFDLFGFPGRYLISSEDDPHQPGPTLVRLGSTGAVVDRFQLPGGAISGIAVTDDGYIHVAQGNVLVTLDSQLHEIGAVTGFDSLWGIAAAPEPSTLALLTAALGAALARRRSGGGRRA
jgi:hypothetical protein